MLCRAQQNGLNRRTSTFGKRRQAAKHRIAADRVEVVHEQAHAHAAQRGVAQAAHEQPAGAIVLR